LLICARADVLLCTAVFVVAGCRKTESVTSISGTVIHPSEAVVPGTPVIVRKGCANRAPRLAISSSKRLMLQSKSSRAYSSISN